MGNNYPAHLRLIKRVQAFWEGNNTIPPSDDDEGLIAEFMEIESELFELKNLVLELTIEVLPKIGDIVLLRDGTYGECIEYEHHSGKTAIRTGYKSVDGFMHIRMHPIEQTERIIRRDDKAVIYKSDFDEE